MIGLKCFFRLGIDDYVGIVEMEKGFDRVTAMENAITVKKDRHIVSWTPEVLSLFSFFGFLFLFFLF